MKLDLWRIQSKEDFLQLKTLDLEQFAVEYFARPPLLGQISDGLSKTNDLFLPITAQLAIRLLTNLNSLYHFESETDLVLLEGTCHVQRFELSSEPTKWAWVNTCESSLRSSSVVRSGDKLSSVSKNELLSLEPETICLLAEWNYKPPARYFANNLELESLELSDQGRKLIKLSRNIYAQDGSQNSEELKTKFFEILSKINERDLFLIHMTKSFLGHPLQVTHFESYMLTFHQELMALARPA